MAVILACCVLYLARDKDSTLASGWRLAGWAGVCVRCVGQLFSRGPFGVAGQCVTWRALRGLPGAVRGAFTDAIPRSESRQGEGGDSPQPHSKNKLMRVCMCVFTTSLSLPLYVCERKKKNNITLTLSCPSGAGLEKHVTERSHEPQTLTQSQCFDQAT